MSVNRRARLAWLAHVARPVIVLLVLVGLWLMHGMFGTTEAGCQGGAMPVSMSVSVPVAAPGAVPDVAAAHAFMPSVPAAAGSRAVAPSVGAGLAEAMRHGELCQSGQPPTPGRDMLVLLALLALAGPIAARDVACEPFGLPLARRAGKRAPPGLFGTGLLTAVCVSRT